MAPRSPSAGTDHAALMDGIYRGQRHIYDLTRKFYLLGRDRLIADLQPQANGTVLELGCGTGRNLIAVAKRYPSVKLYGIDISNEMLITARANVSKAGFADRIALAQGDASSVDTQAAFGIDRFDRVFVSYAVSMIPPWRETLAHALELTQPGGRCAIVDFGQQAQLPRWFRSGLHAWLAKFSVEPRGALEDELRRLATRHGATLAWHSLYRDYTHYAVLTVAR